VKSAQLAVAQARRQSLTSWMLVTGWPFTPHRKLPTAESGAGSLLDGVL